MRKYGKHPKFTGEKKEKGICWEREGEAVYIEPYGQNGIRFRSSATLRIDMDLNWTLLQVDSDLNANVDVQTDRAVITNGKIRAVLFGDGSICYENAEGNILLEEQWIDKRIGTAPQRDARVYNHISSDAFKTDVFFQPYAEEHFYGLGQDANDCINLKGASIELFQKNTKCTIPYILSSRGYGFIWNNPSIGRVDLSTNHTRWHSEACKQIDYIVIAGDSPEEINKSYTEMTGRTDMLPEWAAGFWQSRLRYTTQKEVLQIADEYKKRKIPLSVLIIDYFHWPKQGDWKFDMKYWPDVETMCEELKKNGIHVMVSVWPTVDQRSENYDKMKEKNYLIKAERGISNFFMIMGPQGIFDATHEGARKYVWNCIEKNYYKKGIKSFWLDEAEPEMRPYCYDNIRYYLGNGLEVSNIYPFYYAKAFYDGMKKCGQNEIVNLSRCAWLGSQRLGIVLWSGDIPSDFDSLRCQIKAGLNVAISGIPWWTTDIGGFFGGDPKDDDFVELLIRWFEYGAFCPIFRLHGKRLPYDTVNKQKDYDAFLPSCGDNEIWSFGEKAYEIMKKYIFLRERLKPYILKQMFHAHQEGTPVMRPLIYDFYKDVETFDIGDEYMFGPDILVAPVIEQHANARKVYLPKGALWTDAWTNEEYEGGQWIQKEADIDCIPLYLKNGVKLPIQE